MRPIIGDQVRGSGPVVPVQVVVRVRFILVPPTWCCRIAIVKVEYPISTGICGRRITKRHETTDVPVPHPTFFDPNAPREGDPEIRGREDETGLPLKLSEFENPVYLFGKTPFCAFIPIQIMDFSAFPQDRENTATADVIDGSRVGLEPLLRNWMAWGWSIIKIPGNNVTHVPICKGIEFFRDCVQLGVPVGVQVVVKDNLD
jgi:hypothetical protein